jgi:hypothetical protein
MSYNSLSNYYTIQYSLKQHHSWGIEEQENMFPFERDITVQMVMNTMKELEEARKRANKS